MAIKYLIVLAVLLIVGGVAGIYSIERAKYDKEVAMENTLRAGDMQMVRDTAGAMKQLDEIIKQTENPAGGKK